MAGRMVLYKLVVLGDGGVGKTALTIQLCLQHFVETVGDKSLESSSAPQQITDVKKSPADPSSSLIVRSHD